jgi:hypothetical protein
MRSSHIIRHPDVRRDPDFPLVCRLIAWVPAFAGMTEKRNEFSVLIAATMCESDSDVRRDDVLRAFSHLAVPWRSSIQPTGF